MPRRQVWEVHDGPEDKNMRSIRISVWLGMVCMLSSFSPALARGQAIPPADVQKQIDALKASDWHFLPAGETKPEFFETYLKAHPEDQAHREAALWWYGVEHHTDGRDRLKAYTSFPLELANKLLAAGQAHPVVQFCQTMLTKFTPNQREPQALREQAKQASSK